MFRSRLCQCLWFGLFGLVVVAACSGGNQGSPQPGQDSGNAPPDTGTGNELPDATTTAQPDTGATDDSTGVDVGAGGSDTSTSTGGQSDAVSTAPSGPCTAEICEGFETVAAGGKPDPALWTGGTAVVDTMHPALGTKQSLHFPPSTGGTNFITLVKPIPGGGKVFYGRVLIWFDRQPIEHPNPLYHWTMIQPEGGGYQLRIGGHIETDGADWIRLNPGAGGGETGLSDLTAIIESQKWYCMEFFYDTPNNEARIWINGRERPVLHWKNSVAGFVFPAVGMNVFRIGFTEYMGTRTPFEVWLDEIALGTKRIGCGNFPALPDASDPSTLKPPPAGQGNGVTACGGCAAGQKCCSMQMGGFHPRCAPSANVCLATSCQISCDGPEDCPGQQCCIEPVSQISGCQASCDSGTFVRLCHAPGDCAAGQMCCPTKFTAQALDTYSYCSAGPCP
jgi:hypothetical protein